MKRGDKVSEEAPDKRKKGGDDLRARLITMGPTSREK